MGGALTRMVGRTVAASGIYSGAYKTITVPSGQVSADVTGFPVYVDLSDMGAGFWSGVDAAGAEMRVTNSTGSTALPIDVVTINTGGNTGRMFFKADLLTASNNVFRIYYDTGLGAPAATDPEGRNAVWSTRFDRVFDGIGNVDRTGSGNTLTLVGNAAFSSGQIVFDGVNDFAYVPCTAPTDFTIFVVGHFDGDVPAGQGHVIASYATAGTGTPGYRNSLLMRDTGNWAIWNNSTTWLESGTAVSFNTDFTAANYHDAPGVKRAVWLNGVELTSSSGANTPTGTTPHFTLGGEDDTPATEFQGKLDLATYATEALPSAYLAGLHNNRRNRASFYAIT